MADTDTETDTPLLPDALRINAWTGPGPAATTPLAQTWAAWATARHMASANKTMAAAEPVDERDWQDPRVGWGLLVADNDALSQADRALGTDLPDVLRELVQRRNGPIVRYREENSLESLRRYYVDGPAQDISLTAKAGVARGMLPKYLLIWASPAKGGQPACVPWRFQYVLNVARYVGRLHLQGTPLENYVKALLDDWKGCAARADVPVLWATDHADADITHLMRRVVAEPVEKKLREDAQIGAKLRYFASAAASAAQLIDALADPARPPAFVMTTSHGMTGPLDDVAKMAATLGLLVDQHGALLDPAALLAKWQPDGAIWYAHACCSAGSDDATQYADLVGDGPVKDVLLGVASLGATVAPLPTALLGAERPLRAFVGHVEPTFDWTLRHPESKEPLTHALRTALYDGMHRARPNPVGMAFEPVFDQVGQLFAQFQQATKASTSLDPAQRRRARAAALRTQLGALDRQACVILGDPTVALPALG